MPTEMKTTSTQDAPNPASAELDPHALSAIRDLMQQESAPQPRRTLTRLVHSAALKQPLEPAEPEAPAPRMQPVSERRPAASAAFEEVAPQEAIKARSSGRISRVKARLTGYRPTSKHILVALAALIVFFRPWLVVGLVFIALMATVCVFLIFGYDGFWQRVLGFARWYADRRPARAQELHRKLDSFALKWDAFLDRFPEGTVDGLYLPDLSDLAKADARHEEAVDRRLSGLREQDA
ncbi:MAG: hypothetical protein AAF307_05270 [Pseudomonadota bacterium]